MTQLPFSLSRSSCTPCTSTNRGCTWSGKSAARSCPRWRPYLSARAREPSPSPRPCSPPSRRTRTSRFVLTGSPSSHHLHPYENNCENCITQLTADRLHGPTKILLIFWSIYLGGKLDLKKKKILLTLFIVIVIFMKSNYNILYLSLSNGNMDCQVIFFLWSICQIR